MLRKNIFTQWPNKCWGLPNLCEWQCQHEFDWKKMLIGSHIKRGPKWKTLSKEGGTNWPSLLCCVSFIFIYIFLKSWGIETSRPRVYIYIWVVRDPPWLLPSNSSILPIFSPTLPRRNRGRKREEREKIGSTCRPYRPREKEKRRERERKKKRHVNDTHTQHTTCTRKKRLLLAL